MTESRPFLEVKDLDYIYEDGTQALREVSVSLEDGDFVALIGQNGSGKTTLSKCLNGLFKPTAGLVSVDGLNTRETSITKMAVRVGYVFQNPDHQLFNSSVWDEIAYGPRNVELPKEEIKERVEEAADVDGLSADLFEKHPFFLQKGIRQRVAIASILALRPKVIIVDEPTTGQDRKQSLEIMNFLTRLHEEQNHIIVFITHDMPIVSQYAKRIVLMGEGQILADGPTSEVFAQPEKLARTFVEPPQITQLAQAVQDLGFDPGTLRVEEMLKSFRELTSR